MILSIPLLTTQEADNPSDHLKPEKSSTTHRCTRARVPPPPTKSSPSFPALFYWPVFDWISSYQCSYWSVLWIWIDCHWICSPAVWLGTVPGEWTLDGSECPHKASRFLQSKPKNKHYLWLSSTSVANSGTILKITLPLINN